MGHRLTRRRALGALGASVTATLAGCRSPGVRRVSTFAPSAGVAGDAFGWDVALTARWTLVGAPATGDPQQGAAYLYDADGTSEQRLAPGTATGAFGTAVAVSGERAVVGAPATGDPDTGGAVTVFLRRDDRWRRARRLVAPGPAMAFGYDVALSGGRLLVGARATERDGATDAGVAYVYECAEGGWDNRVTLARQAADPYEYTGGSVALDGDRALLGSFLADDAAPDAGAVTAFERTDGWHERVSLTAPDAGPGDRFGNAVALDGDRALVGAVGRGGGADAAADRGGAYVFERADGEWDHAATLPGPADDPDAAFGVAVALDGDWALVGAFSANGTDPGRAFLFERGDDGWTQRATLRPADGDPGDGFGGSVALDGDRAVVGAVNDGAGTATLFVL